ncbi:MAG TPA: endo-1,4-beta-xylanase [Bacteroidales bacterium]|nr:endo-1,4-beta-xylanase [Bacteroidales bacterium]
MRAYRKSYSVFLLGFFLAIPCFISAQDLLLNESIEKNRKGEITILAKKGDNIKVEQLRHEFWFGAAIPNNFDGSMPANDLKQFRQKFLELFNYAVTENALKWQSMERNKGEVRYATVDSILAWCEKNNIPLRGHNIYWGKKQYVQPWVMELSDDELRQALQERGESITRHYKGRFAEYDLNNEMLDENYYEERLGPGITKQLAQWALNGDPDAKLILNEHDVFVPLDGPLGNKLANYMTLIRTLLKQGVPISGIAIQGHSHLYTFDRQALKTGLDSLAKFNIPIRITEFNMPGRGYPSILDKEPIRVAPEQEEARAKEIVDWYRICFAHPAVEGIIMWGFWEGANWIPASSLYKRDWTPTPAADAYKNLVFKEWWTNTSGVAGKNGKYSTRAFYGKYRITVNGVSRVIDLEKSKGNVIADFRKNK